jgi:hypothetical protein
MWESIVDSNVRFRYSYTGSGWSVRSIDPEKAEPKRDARRTRRFAVVSGAFALVCVVAGSVIFARRAPQPEQPPSVETASRPDFIVSSPVIPANKVGSIPGLTAPAPATPETREPVEVSRPQPEPTGESVRPSSEGTSTTAVDASRAQPGKAIPRAAQRPGELRGKVARILLSSGPRGDLQSDAVESPIVIAPGQEKSVVLYTELRDLAGQTVFHRWERGGRTMAVIPFRIGSDRWRVHSSKRMTSALKGQWQVVVTDSRGAALASRSFVVR